MRHLEEHEQLRDGALQHLPHQRSGREGRTKWQRHGPTGLCKSVISGTRDLGGSILPPSYVTYERVVEYSLYCTPWNTRDPPSINNKVTRSATPTLHAVPPAPYSTLQSTKGFAQHECMRDKQ
jgi:hypothetical protein